MSMNIYALPGHKVKVTKKTAGNGEVYDKANVENFLEIDVEYIVKRTTVGGFKTSVLLEGLDVYFNSVNFVDVTKQSKIDNHKHPMWKNIINMMTIEDVSKMINSYVNSGKQEDIYKAWVSMYIAGDRIKSDKVFEVFNDLLKIYAINFRKEFSFKKEPLFRGVLVAPNYDIEKHKIWDYSHVSFTEDPNVALSFADIKSTYGIVFPRDYIGHVIAYNMDDTEFVWFHYSWAEKMNDPVFAKFVKFWNQKEVILGKHI